MATPDSKVRPSASQLSTKSAWLTFVVTIFGTVSIVMGQYKVTGTMTYIISDWGINVTTAGLLMSIIALGALAAALPGGGIINKIGARNAMLLTLALCAISNIMGAFAHNFAFLATARFIEGLCNGMSSVVAPVIVAQAFTSEKRGLPMTLWGIRTAIGTLLILNACNFITPAWGWQANWWACAAVEILALVLCFFFLKLPPVHKVAKENQDKDTTHEAKGGKKQGAWAKCLKNPAVICIFIINFAQFFGFSVYGSFYPTYLSSFAGIDPAQANQIGSIHTYLMIFIALTFGFVLNKIPNKHHPKLLVPAIAMSLVGNIMLWTMPSIALDIVGILLCAAGTQFLGPLDHNLIPDAVEDDAPSVAIGMALLALSASSAAIIATLVCGRIVDATGGNWAMLAVPTAGIALVGFFAALVNLKVMSSKEHASEEIAARGSSKADR